mmetsp:Transcript_43029/g.125129  ORF Transcript_43029/g.125129 Transcript_43029/m.125129 type:complete len:248 (+) Transcript_43029:284-1027(+)
MLGQALLLRTVQSEVAVFEDGLSTDPTQAAARHGSAVGAEGLAHLCHQPAHIRVVPSHGALEQGPVDDGLADAAGHVVVGGACHEHPHHVLRALAVAHDLPSEVAADAAQGLLEGILRRRRRPAARQKHNGVARGGVAVDGARVEARAHCVGEHALQSDPSAGRRLHVREDIAEHGGHVGLDHAGALRNANDAPAAGEFHGADLRVAVGGHDAPRSRQHRVRLQGCGRRRHCGFHLLDGEAPPDDAS